MAIQVDIADRFYDFTDEEKAAEAIAEYQADTGLNDHAVVALWLNEGDPRRVTLEALIFDAVDANGSVKRAKDNVPGGITLAASQSPRKACG